MMLGCTMKWFSYIHETFVVTSTKSHNCQHHHELIRRQNDACGSPPRFLQ